MPGRALSNRTQGAAPARGRKSAMLPAGPGVRRAPRPPQDWIAVPVPPVVSEETFAQVQAKLDANQQGAARNTRHEYLLRALISCGACPGWVRRPFQTAAGYRYYLCRGRTDPLRVAQGQRCTARYIPAGQLDELVWADLCALLTDPAQVTRALARAQGGAWLPQELQARQATIGQALGQLERQQQRLLDAYLAEVIALPELERKRQDLDRRHATLLAQQRQLDAAARQKLELGAVADGIEAFCQAVRAGLATVLARQVHAHPDLAVAGLAQRPGVLPGHARRRVPVLGEPGVIHHQRIHQLAGREPSRHVAPDRRVIPRRGRDELLQPLMVSAQPRRHRLHRLARPVRQQPARIQLARPPAGPCAAGRRASPRQSPPARAGPPRSPEESRQDHTTKPGSRPDLTKYY